MNMQEKLNGIEPLIKATDDELKRLGEQHSCIFAGAVLSKVFKAEGFGDAYPLTVKPLILNPAFAEKIKGRSIPTDAATQEKWAEEGCSMIAIGAGGAVSTDEQWAGHMIVVLPSFFNDRHAFCDLTITQANKLEWDIVLGPIFARVPHTFVTGETDFKAPANGCIVVYKAFPEDRSFESAPVWQNQPYQDLAVKNIVG